ncbi:MAG TPA: hypothetical protein VFY90_05640 [Tepidiformaceae bacterium]|nr:hypothetical protein [Tepidiformaceae bacterium]
MTENFPEGWDEARVRRVLEHYENQTEEEAVAEDEAYWSHPGYRAVLVPNELVPQVEQLIEAHEARKAS